MKSDLVHSIVQSGPQVQRPKANYEPVGAKEVHSEKPLKRTLLESNLLKQLVTEVKETVATDVEVPGARKSSFGRLKLWDMRRRSRFAGYGLKQPRITTGIGY